MEARVITNVQANPKVKFLSFVCLQLLFFICLLGRDQPAKKSQPQAMTDALLLDTEAAVMSSFAFLEPADDVEMDDEDYMSEEPEDDGSMKQLKLKTKGVIVHDGMQLIVLHSLQLTNFCVTYR
jgi:hypothetical protein